MNTEYQQLVCHKPAAKQPLLGQSVGPFHHSENQAHPPILLYSSLSQDAGTHHPSSLQLSDIELHAAYISSPCSSILGVGPPSKLSSWNKSRIPDPPPPPPPAKQCSVCTAVCMTRSKINSLRLSTLSREAEAWISKSNYETISGWAKVLSTDHIVQILNWAAWSETFSLFCVSPVKFTVWRVGRWKGVGEEPNHTKREKAWSSINHLKLSGSEWGWLWLSVDALLMRKI